MKVGYEWSSNLSLLPSSIFRMMGIPLEAFRQKKSLSQAQTFQQVVENLHESIHSPYLYILTLEAWLYWVGLQVRYGFSVQWL